jgi:DNA-binding Lrp family transcriptional regulator
LHATRLEKQLCNALQKGLPICERPFAKLAKDLNSDEREILRLTRRLKSQRIIRRIGALINYRALGIKSTLVAAHIPQENLPEIAGAVGSLEGVSHNYLRRHYYNLWFTLQARTDADIKVVLAMLSRRFHIDFYSLPVKRVFKLDVFFDANSDGKRLLQGFQKTPRSRLVKLDKNQRLILSKLQDDLYVNEKPFAFLCSRRMDTTDVLRIIAELIAKGVIRRIAGVVDHRKLGFAANALFAGEVPKNKVVEVGKKLSRLRIVSHCYERKTFEGWPYNLFAMMHGKNMSQIQRVIKRFVKAEKVNSFQLLPTVAELKKQPVKQNLFYTNFTF